MQGFGEVEPNLGVASGGIPPKLFTHARCARLIETLPGLQHDPHGPEDALKVDADEDDLGGDVPPTACVSGGDKNPDD